MNVAPQRANEIAARLRQEDARLRRRTLWYALLPLAVGAIVLGIAWGGVQQARDAKEKLDEEVKAGKLAAEELKSVVNALLKESASLQRDIDERRSLLARIAEAAPEQQRDEINAMEQGLERDRTKLGAQAAVVYGEAIEAAGDSAIAYQLRGSAQYRSGEFEQAAASLNKALLLAPADAESRAMLALTLWALGKQDAALEELEVAFKDPNVQARVLQDPAYKPLRDEIDARSGAGSGGSEQEKTWIQTGLAAAKSGDFSAAIDAYGKALKLNPGNATVLGWQGYALYRIKRYDEAIKTLRQALTIEPNAVVTRYNLALALWKIDLANEAKRELKAAYSSDPDFETIAKRDPQSAALRRAMAQ